MFLGEPLVTPALLRALGQLAGCHIWNYQEDLVHVRPPFLLVHCAGAGQRTITLPSKWSAYDTVTGEWVATDATSLRFNAIDGSSHLFLVGPQVELEQILASDRGALLDMPELPRGPVVNTIPDVPGLFAPGPAESAC